MALDMSMIDMSQMDLVKDYSFFSEPTTNEGFCSGSESSGRSSGASLTDLGFFWSPPGSDILEVVEKNWEEQTEEAKEIRGFKMPELLESPIVCPHLRPSAPLDPAFVEKLRSQWSSPLKPDSVVVFPPTDQADKSPSNIQNTLPKNVPLADAKRQATHRSSVPSRSFQNSKNAVF